MELTNFVDFSELTNFTELTKLAKKKSDFTEKFELPEKRGPPGKEVPAPRPTPIYKLSMISAWCLRDVSVMSMVWNISIDQLGYLSGYAPSQLLCTCLLAEHGKPRKSLIFLTKTISVINIRLVLNPKHSSYWEEN